MNIMGFTMNVTKALSILLAILFVGTQLHAQTRKGDLTASASYSALFYSGEFGSDEVGDGGMFTLSYNTSDRLWVEGRLGFGTYHWQTNASLLNKYSDYYGNGAAFGGAYPGSLTKIQSQNQAGLTSLDVTVGYILMKNASFTPFVSGGLGLVHFTPQTSGDGDPLPNYEKGVYPSSVASIPLGVGLLIPVTNELAITARYDHRFVFSGYLDDYQVRGTNDGLSAVSLGLSYRFNDRAEQSKGRFWCKQCSTWYDIDNCSICAAQNCEICRQRSRGIEDQVAVDQRAEEPAEPALPPDTEEVTPAPAPAAEEAAPEPAEPRQPKRKLTAQGIRFNVNSDIIDFNDPTTKMRMNEMLEYLTQDCQDLEVLVEGHASVDGPDKRNKELSVLRARSVAKWLLENGVPPERIRGAVGYGSSMPIVPDPPKAIARKMTKKQLEAIREQNRRIELSILKDCE